MGEWEYIIEPLPGYTIAEAVEDPQIWNSQIKVMDGREIIDFMPMTERNSYRKDLKPPPEYYLLEEVRTSEGLIPIDKTVPENTLVPQINPFHQIIYAIVSGIGRTKPDTIHKSLTKEYRVFPDNDIARGIINDLIVTMDKRAHLLYYVEKGVFYYVRGRPLEADEVYLIDLHRGYDPIAWQILDYIKMHGRTNRGSIDNYIQINIGWLRQMNSINYYLNSLEKGTLWGESVCSQKTGNIERVRENEYIYKYPLEPWGETTIQKRG